MIYAGEAKKDGKLVHVLAYQNLAESNVPNAMTLPIPAKNIGQENCIDTRPFKNFLKNIIDSAKSPLLSRSAKGVAASAASSYGEVFDVGSYTVVIAKTAHPSGIRALLKQVPENKRPEVNVEIFQSLYKLYENWPIAICCWSGTIKPEPILFYYEPLHEDVLFAPGLDAHDGKAPIRNQVRVDARITFGSVGHDIGHRDIVFEDSVPPSVKDLFPKSVAGTEYSGIYLNGDYVSRVADLKATTDLTNASRFTKQTNPSVSRLFPGTDLYDAHSLTGWHE
jgi:hypothetical protein